MEKANLIHEFDKNSTEKVRFAFQEFRRRQYLDVRVYFDASENGSPNWLPSKKGICISLDLIDELKKGVDKAVACVAIEGI